VRVYGCEVERGSTHLLREDVVAMTELANTEVTPEVTYITTRQSDLIVAAARVEAYGEAVANTIKLLTEALQTAIDEGDLEKSVARSIWTTANAGYSEGNPFVTTWTVTVGLDGDELLTLEGIEAESAQEACDEVGNDIQVEDIEVSCTIRYGKNYYTSATIDELDSSYYTVEDSAIIEALDISAEPEDEA
jgi:hypothetical protein